MMRLSRHAYRQEQRASRSAIVAQFGRDRTTFVGDNLVTNAGLLAPGVLAQKLGVAELIDEHPPPARRCGGSGERCTEAVTVIGAMLAGADPIADIDILRAGCEVYGTGKQGASRARPGS